MSTIVTRAGKGSPLTHAEVDSNFTNLNSDKVEASAGTLTNPSIAGVASFADGSASAPAITNTGDTNTGIFFPAADTIAFAEGGTEAMRIDSSGNVGIGTNSPDTKVHAYNTASNTWFRAQSGGDNSNGLYMTNNQRSWLWGLSGGGAGSIYLYDLTGSKEVLNISSSGNLGLAITPSAWSAGRPALEFGGSVQAAVAFNGNNGNGGAITANAFFNGSNWVYKNSTAAAMYQNAGATHAWFNAGSGTAGNAITFTQAMTLDASGNLGIGTTSPSTPLDVQANASAQGIRVRGRASGDGGNIAFFSNNNATEQLSIFSSSAENAFFGTGSRPMVFSTNSTERMRISSGGVLLVGKTAQSLGTAGFEARQDGSTFVTLSGDTPLYVNRLTNDGNLVNFYQDSNVEGSISVSGTTVSYNGGHLARWSQLLDGSKDESLLKGTVLSNLDEMCVWIKDGEQLPNEQLNKMKVSDVEGDTNVAGVFVNWTRDEDCNTDDLNIAMTGDMIIRIAQGVTVARGDLLMSAGNGTAKPQGDDIVRAKTIAKVTSTNVTCTYADGSYCVPCVLMAC